MQIKSIFGTIIDRFRMATRGQVLRHHEIGKWIEFLSSLEGVETIVEIGTWNGKGTSSAIVRGVRAKKSIPVSMTVIGLEINPMMYKRATKTLKNANFFEVVQGSIVDIQSLDNTDLSPTEMIWFKQDLDYMAQVPNVRDRIPDLIDLLILDGGEFSTYSEYKELVDNINGWLILDDTKVRKSLRILNEIAQEGDQSKFNIVWQSQERNGTAVLQRKNS